MLDDWQSGRDFAGLRMTDLVRVSQELADDLHPEAAPVKERRLRVAGEACELFVEGSNADREALGDRVGRSPALIWVLNQYLDAVRPPDDVATLRALAAVSLIAADEDRRDLLLRLRTLQQQAERVGVDLTPLVVHMARLSEPTARDILSTWLARPSNEASGA